ncbi:MAG: hypothetical protein ABIJ61_01880, partial [bacterium]
MQVFKSPWGTLLALCLVLMFLVVSDAQAAVKCRWFKNTSAVSANDFHADKGSGAGKIKTASATNEGTGNSAFPDRVFADPGVDSFDWDDTDNTEPIPAGGYMKVCSEPNSINTATSYFTKDGVQIATSGYSSKPRALSTKVGFKNDAHSVGIVVFPGDLFINNTGDPDDFGFVPDGISVTGLPTSFTLNPGQEIFFDVAGIDPGLPIYYYGETAPASEPTDVYPQLDVFLVSADAIPTLSEWAMIIFAVVILGMITYVVIRKRRNIASAAAESYGKKEEQAGALQKALPLRSNQSVGARVQGPDKGLCDLPAVHRHRLLIGAKQHRQQTGAGAAQPTDRLGWRGGVESARHCGDGESYQHHLECCQ